MLPKLFCRIFGEAWKSSMWSLVTIAGLVAAAVPEPPRQQWLRWVFAIVSAASHFQQGRLQVDQPQIAALKDDHKEIRQDVQTLKTEVQQIK
jgi:hypothetical protein